MHLWPSLRLRDSFKEAYLKKLDWNLSRMNSEKQRQNQPGSSDQQHKRLLEKEDDPGCGGFVYIFRELLLILSCCYCCFCCGACVEDEESR